MVNRPAAVVPPGLALEEVESRFPRYRDANWRQLNRACWQWVVDQRLMSADITSVWADRLHYTDLVAGYYVGAPLPVLKAIADFSIWFFAWDDWHGVAAARRWDRRWQRLNTNLRIALKHPWAHRHHSDPLVAAFADSVGRLLGHLGDGWNARFAAHFCPVFDAYDQEYHNRIAGVVPTVDQYMELRRHTFGHWLWLDLLEQVAQRPLPPSIRHTEAYRQAGLASQDFAAWYNDLCSLPKELAAGEPHNLGISLMHQHGLTVGQARDVMRRRLRERVTRFLSAESKLVTVRASLPHDLWQALDMCIFNMRNWFSSVYWFHHEAGRYRLDEWDNPAQPPYADDVGRMRNIGNKT